MQVANSMKNTNNKKGLFLFVLMLFCWFLIVSLAKDLTKVEDGFKRIDDAAKKLSSEEIKNSDLKKKITFVQSDYYKEKVVREKLNMQLPGETVVVLNESGAVSDPGMENDAKNELKTQNNWEKWWSIVLR